MAEFHPELRRAAGMIPRFAFTPTLARFARFLQRLRGVPKPPRPEGLSVRDVVIPASGDRPDLRVRVYAPDTVAAPRPAMLWIHGGGFIIGTPEQDEANIIALCRELDMAVVAVAYRLGPDHPHPAALHDCYAALEWLHGHAGILGVDAGRIAIGGNS
ncbi:MAG TPA: alpha/beta hydrolase, partial [Novosphingobium sp.]|nr:alpha/beta hydrolase [Novosphingobium sp.]